MASSDAIVLRAKKEEYRSIILLIASSDAFVAETSQKMKEGSKMPRADWNIMSQYPVVFPIHTILQALNEFIKPIVEQLRVLAFQNIRLKQARDLLLPKLMSGEVGV